MDTTKPTLPRIVAFIGGAGVGKSTAADALSARLNYRRVAFSDPLKDVCAAVFGWPPDLLRGRGEESRRLREQPDPWWAERLGIAGFSPRMALQMVGTDLFRNHLDENIWVHAFERRIANGNGRWVVDDVRFPNEARKLREMGALLVGIDRPSVAESLPTRNHESERMYRFIEVDAVVRNTEDIETFRNRVIEIVRAGG